MVITLLGLGGCQIENAPTNQKSKPDTQAVELALVRDMVAHDLKDPSSAQFRNVRRLSLFESGPLAEGDPWDASGLYCGEVNGKNAFGAYSGFQNFFVWGPDLKGKFNDDPVHIYDPTDPASKLAYMTYCLDQNQNEKKGIPVNLPK